MLLPYTRQAKHLGRRAVALLSPPMINQGLWVNNLAPVTQTSVTPAMGD